MTDQRKVVSTFQFSLASLQVLREAAQREVICVNSREDFLARLPEAEILCASELPANWRSLTPQLRWLQTSGAGVDGLLSTDILDPESGVLVTTAVGIHAIPVSEYVFGSLLLFNRRWAEMVRLQDRHLWPQSPNWYHLGGRELANRTLGIIGLGAIGKRVARLAKAYEMRVLATKRTVTPDLQEEYVDQLYPMTQLQALLRQCDYVVIAVPLTPETTHLISEAELRALPSHAYLVNVARGQVIDERALIRALTEKWIAGAGLDVVVEEPLPAESPLFALPNVMITPHISGSSPQYDQRLTSLFAENLRLYRAGQPLHNLYRAERGY
ncbi:D-2-hydroxyacid dehydrogenase [Tengunoibacter tsumagoiensis]|uniref:Hydroxyacid dehydrogenase n=1 Tax=Tengunoibacter tsumagoiensis TaxID=2014871 RepID=A0A402A5K7_9CHLR|nr:D-2-hydroxyacid dehydrogenase [Tengunoibacter tsumagoiensis]GCE14305.1 hydroxyacid dehydrogenase [Tengunoibacter tsumagoiensis]